MKTTKATVKRTGEKKSPTRKASGTKKNIVPKGIIKKPALKKPSKDPQGLPEQMLDVALKILDERQAEEVVAIPLSGRSSVADYLIIASGRAGRQITAIADYLREAFLKLGVRHIRVEGMGEANWVLVDAGDVVIHLFRPEVRRYYDLDSIWKGRQLKT